MKTLRLLLGLVLGVGTTGLLRSQTATLFTVQDNGTRSQRINLVFLSEGYTAADMSRFAGDVNAAVAFLFGKEPWQQYRSYCNIYRIEIASNESGCDNGNTSGAGGVRDTYFDTGFTTPSVGQLLTLGGNGYSRAYSLLNTHVPEYDLAIVLVNDTKYGGAGGGIAVASVHNLSAAVVEHEIGHTFAFLADEYDAEYTIYTPSEQPNTTAETNRALIRWKHWIEDSTPVPTPETNPYDSLVGLFEGSMYRIAGWYRPHNNSLMRNLNRPVGQVNREQFVLQFYQRVSPVDARSPSSAGVAVTTIGPLNFSVTPKLPSSGVPLQITWRVNNVVQSGQTLSQFSTHSALLGNGTHIVSAIVKDPTDFVRLDPNALLNQTVAWTLTVSGQLPANLAAWRTAYGADTLVTTADGLPNLVKYALGLNASVTARPEETPGFSQSEISGERYVTLTVPRRMKRQDVSYVVQVSNNLTDWFSGAGQTVVLQDTETQLVVRDATPMTAASPRFIRLAVQPLE